MKTCLLACLAILIGNWARAAGPTTHPSSPQVTVTPFVQITAEKSQDWVGRAVQQSMLSELARVPGLQPVEPKRSASEAQFIVSGSYQILNDEIRITGQVIDSRAKATLGGLKATGSLRELFSLEDTLAMQAKRILARVNPIAAAQPPSPVGETFAIAPSGPLCVATRARPWIGDVNDATPSGQAKVSYDYYYGRYYDCYYWGCCGYAPAYWCAPVYSPCGYSRFIDP